jgi:hypothetical protein
MRQTLSEIKNQVRKQIAVSDKLVYLEKAPNGKVVEIHLLEWHTDESLDTWKKQAELNKTEYEHEIKQKETQKETLLNNRFESITKALIDTQKELERLKMEIQFIKGEITEEQYAEFMEGSEE